MGQGISKDRIVSSAVMVMIIVLAIFNKWTFIAVLIALIIGGLYEFFYLVKKKGIPIYSYTGIAIGVFIPISIFARFEPTKGWELLFFVLLLVIIFVMQFTRKDNNNAIVGISTTLFGVLYVSWLFSFLIKIRYLLPEPAGIKLLAYVLIVTKMGDIGALVVGSKFGKHPLFPRISPNKTIEGSVGSFIFSILAAFAVKSFLPPGIFEDWQIIMMGFLLGGVGQLGDLSESLIKRDCHVKDSGKMLPALGGVLDTIDSVLFCAPTFYFYMAYCLKV